MIPYREQKIENAIAYFVREYNSRTRKPLYQMFLYKLLAFLDFESVKETGEPSLALTYRAMKMGPVPIEIYSEKQYRISDKYVVSEDEDKVFFSPSGVKPDLDYFSKFELSEMSRLIGIYSEGYVTAKFMSEASHQDIMAWRRTWKEKENSIIKYEKEFPGNVFTRKPSTPAEEHFLTTHAVLEKAHACS